jgi:hypothetical protein
MEQFFYTKKAVLVETAFQTFKTKQTNRIIP